MNGLSNDLGQVIAPLLCIVLFLLLVIAAESLFELVLKELYIYHETDSLRKAYRRRYRKERAQAVKSFRERLNDLENSEDVIYAESEHR